MSTTAATAADLLGGVSKPAEQLSSDSAKLGRQGLVVPQKLPLIPRQPGGGRARTFLAHQVFDANLQRRGEPAQSGESRGEVAVLVARERGRLDVDELPEALLAQVGALAGQAKVFSDHLGERTGHLLSYSWSGHAHHDGGRIKIMFCLVIFDKFTDHPRRMGDGAPSSGGLVAGAGFSPRRMYQRVRAPSPVRLRGAVVVTLDPVEDTDHLESRRHAHMGTVRRPTGNSSLARALVPGGFSRVLEHRPTLEETP